MAAAGGVWGLLAASAGGPGAALRGAALGLGGGLLPGLLLGALDRLSPWPGGLWGPLVGWLRQGPGGLPARSAGVLAALLFGALVHFALAAWVYQTFHHLLLSAGLLTAAAVSLLPLQAALLNLWQRIHARLPLGSVVALGGAAVSLALGLASVASAEAVVQQLSAPVGAVVVGVWVWRWWTTRRASLP